LGEAREVVDNDGDGSSDAASSEGAEQPLGVRVEVRVPSVNGTEAPPPPGDKARRTATAARRESAWTQEGEEDRAVARRLEHLDRVAARLEEAGAEIEANIDLLGLEHGRAPRRSAAATYGGGNGGLPDIIYHDARRRSTGRVEEDHSISRFANGGRRRRARKRRDGGDKRVDSPVALQRPARGRPKARGGGEGGRGGGVVSRRLAAPTVSSSNKAVASSSGGGGG
ncbi:unnamed protein product, partial [Ectocarpus sp. 12 AP-2014]